LRRDEPKKMINLPDDKISREILENLTDLKAVVVDACSLIYLERVQMLESLAAQVKLITLPCIVAESRLSDPPVTLMIDPNDELCNDQRIYALAEKLNLPLLSDDGILLRKADKADRPHYNTLMMLILLFTKNTSSESELRRACSSLKSFARYHPKIWQYAETLLRIARKNP